jgi:hypothetical protein
MEEYLKLTPTNWRTSRCAAQLGPSCNSANTRHLRRTSLPHFCPQSMPDGAPSGQRKKYRASRYDWIPSRPVSGSSGKETLRSFCVHICAHVLIVRLVVFHVLEKPAASAMRVRAPPTLHHLFPLFARRFGHGARSPSFAGFSGAFPVRSFRHPSGQQRLVLHHFLVRRARRTARHRKSGEKSD